MVAELVLDGAHGLAAILEGVGVGDVEFEEDLSDGHKGRDQRIREQGGPFLQSTECCGADLAVRLLCSLWAECLARRESIPRDAGDWGAEAVRQANVGRAEGGSVTQASWRCGQGRR